MFRCLFRLILLGVLAIVAIIILAPRFLDQAGNSLLNALNNSAVSGLAQFIPANFTDKNTHLQISINGLSANGKYDVTLDNTACGNPFIIDLGPVTADSSGNINQVFNLGKFDTGQTWYVDVHKGSDASGNALACGQLVINATSVADEVTPIITLSPGITEQTSAPTIANVTPTPTLITTPGVTLPHTGVKPGDNNTYDNYVYPRKF
jgi:hypothetical protein